LKVAQWVLAIGNPFQLNPDGDTWHRFRPWPDEPGYFRLRGFHPDRRSDQPRQLGGALVNTRGELVGFNTAIFSQSGGYQGIGFAIPSNLARPRSERLPQIW
jgi:S1-C subfamily serine protease